MSCNSPEKVAKLQRSIKKAVFENKRNIAFTGPGGTGKSYEIKRLKAMANTLNISFAVTSTTGVSSLSVEGVTIHRWSCIKIGKESAITIAKKIQGNKDALKRILEAKILVIDEVSMLGAKIFYLIHDVCQRVREEFNDPFGGIQIILSFDFLQLPPVNDDFAFTHELWRELNLQYFKFEIPQRFPDINHFNLLKRARLGKLTKEDCKNLRLRVGAFHDYLRRGEKNNEIKPTKIHSKKCDVEKVNLDELAKLPGDPVGYRARDKFVLVKKKSKKLLGDKLKKKGDKKGNGDNIENANLLKELLPAIVMKENVDHVVNPSDEGKVPDIIDKKDIEDYTDYFNTIVPQCIFFKPGAQVMLTYNLDLSCGLANGSRGVVISCEADGLVVKFMNGLETKIGFNTYEFEDNKMKVTRLQLPFILAWSLSIHKTQGASLDCAIIDLGPSVFCEGMGYVALSRVRTLEGIYLTNFIPEKIYADENALIFEEEMDAIIARDHEEENEREEGQPPSDDENENQPGEIKVNKNPCSFGVGHCPNSKQDEVLMFADEEEEILLFATDSEDEN